MTPETRAILDEVAKLYGIDPAILLIKCRTRKVFQARREVAKRLDARGYSAASIGRILKHDHTTILYYLGRYDRQPTPGLRWRAPKVRVLYVIKKPRPPKPRKRYLIPYAGADPRDYIFTERRPLWTATDSAQQDNP